MSAPRPGAEDRRCAERLCSAGPEASVPRSDWWEVSVERKPEGTAGRSAESKDGTEWVYRKECSGAKVDGEGTESGSTGRVTVMVPLGWAGT